MPRFSVAVIARNEARTLPRLAESLEIFRRAGGSVLLLDTGSDDGTPDLGRRLGFDVVEAGERFTSRLSEVDAARIQARFALDEEGPIVTAGERLFHFGAARQYAGEHAACDFVLLLDASDEVLTLDVDAIDSRIGDGLNRAGGFGFRLRQGGGSFEARRFYDRRFYEWRGRTHEGLYARPAPASVPPSTVSLPEDEILVVHHRQSKERNYLAGLALDAMATPDVPRWRHYTGRELFYGGWYRSAIGVLDEHLRMAGAAPADRAASRCVIAECQERLGDRQAAETTWEQAAAEDGGLREPWLRLAALRSQRGDFGGAVVCGERALAICDRSRAPEADANYTWAPHAVLYWSLFWLGRHAEAERHWEICRSFGPADTSIDDHARLFDQRRHA